MPGVTFEGTDVYAANPHMLLTTLEERNGGARTGLGSVLFVRLGINLGSFRDPDAGSYFDPPPPAATIAAWASSGKERSTPNSTNIRMSPSAR